MVLAAKPGASVDAAVGLGGVPHAQRGVAANGLRMGCVVRALARTNTRNSVADACIACGAARRTTFRAGLIPIDALEDRTWDTLFARVS